MAIGDDGAVYFQQYLRTDERTVVTDCAFNITVESRDDLNLVRVAPDGAVTQSTLRSDLIGPVPAFPSYNRPLLLPSRVSPDGNGGIAASYEVFDVTLPSTGGSIVNSVSSYLNRAGTTVSLDPVSSVSTPPVEWWRSPLEFVGDDAVTYVKSDAGTAALAANGSTLWTSSESQMIAPLRDGGAVFHRSDGTLATVDGTGTVNLMGALALTNPVQIRLGVWTGLAGGSLASVLGPPLDEAIFSSHVAASADPAGGEGFGAPQQSGQAQNKRRNTREQAAIEALDYLYDSSVLSGHEWGAKICRDAGGFFPSRTREGTQSTVNVNTLSCGTATYAARVHTHPPLEHPFPSGYAFYGGDYNNADQEPGIPHYLMAPAPGAPASTHKLKYWNPFPTVFDAARLNTCQRQANGAWTPLVVNSSLGPVQGNCSTPTP